eukprot:814262-Pyramimonas_sp.AAC.1
MEYAKQLADRDSSTRWKDWCDIACAGGAGRLHRITKLNQVQAPTVVRTTTSDGMSGHPHQIVLDMEAKHHKLWKASEEAPFVWAPDRSTMDRPSPRLIRAA